MSAWLRAHVQALTRALARLRTQPLACAMSITVMAIALLLPLLLYTLFANVSAAASRLNTEPNVNVYLALAASEADVNELQKKLRAHANAAEVKFISREVALADMKNNAGLADLLSGITSNPLPHAFTIKPRVLEPAALEAMRKELVAMPKVDVVSMDFEWAKKLTRFARFAERIVFAIGILLAAAVIFVTGNTIRLQMLTQKDEIVVARLIGATRSFVRRPFLYFGAVQGAVAGLLAVLVVMGMAAWMGGELSALATSYGTQFSFQAPSLSEAIAVIGFGGLLGWLGAYLSVAMFWRQAG